MSDESARSVSQAPSAAGAEPTVLYAVRDEIAFITLNRPEARNALSRRLMEELTAAFARASTDAAARVVVLTGAGKAFCAGVDLKEAGTMSGEQVEPGQRPALWRAMEACPRPIIGAINGAAITGGFEIAMACDVLIASTEARFADTHARVGVLPGAGLSQRLARTIGIYRAKYLSLTGNFLSGEQACAWGLVSHVVPPEALEATAVAVAKDMLTVMPHMLEPYKALIDAGYAMDFGAGMDLESRRSTAHIEAMGAWRDARGAFEAVRERGRER